MGSYVKCVAVNGGTDRVPPPATFRGIRFIPGMPIERFMDNQVCYKCGSWKDDYPSSLCNHCRARLQDEFPKSDPLLVLQVRITDDDRMLLWIAGIKVDEDLMDVFCSMTCPRCRKIAYQAELEDLFRCICGWNSNSRSAEETEWKRELLSPLK